LWSHVLVCHAAEALRHLCEVLDLNDVCTRVSLCHDECVAVGVGHVVDHGVLGGVDIGRLVDGLSWAGWWVLAGCLVGGRIMEAISFIS